MRTRTRLPRCVASLTRREPHRFSVSKASRVRADRCHSSSVNASGRGSGLAIPSCLRKALALLYPANLRPSLLRTEWYARTVWVVKPRLIACRPVPSLRQIRLLAELAAAREARGLSQRQLAQRLKRSDSFVSKYEAGERRLTVLEFLDVCDALGADAQGIIKRVMRD